MTTPPSVPPNEAVPPSAPPDERSAAATLPDKSGAPKTPLSKDELEREQLRLTNEKLKIETQKIEKDLKPEKWLPKIAKTIVALGGVIAVLASAYGIYDSYDKTIVDRDRTRVERERTRIAEQRSRFEESIKHLESPNTISKLVGVSVLSGYLDASNKEAHRQVLFTLAALVAAENDPQIQAAVIDLLASIPKDGPIALADWRYFQELLVTQSRAVMAKGNLFHHRQFGVSPLTDAERAARAVGKLIAQNIRKGVVVDYKDYHGIYCEECDFRNVAFPPGVDFTGAVLDRANFVGSTLEAALFDNAELIGTMFVEADLRRARFRSLDETITTGSAKDGVAFGRTAYIDHIVSTLDVNPYIYIKMPDFSCANLEGARFDGHALFPGIVSVRRRYAKEDEGKPGWYRNVTQEIKDGALSKNGFEFRSVQILPPKFYRANIKDADFERTHFFTVTKSDDKGLSSTMMSDASTKSFGDFTVHQGDMEPEAFQTKAEDEPAGRKGSTSVETKNLKNAAGIFRRRLQATFFTTELGNALLPDDLAAFLKNSGSSGGNFMRTFRTRGVVDLHVDQRCRPR